MKYFIYMHRSTALSLDGMSDINIDLYIYKYRSLYYI